MATNTYSEILSNRSKIDQNSINQWFQKKGFSIVEFENNRFKILIDEIYHNIKENENFNTYIKEDIRGSLLVFEIKILHNKFECICYSPITLFGLFEIRNSFKSKSSAITKYRQHGYEYLTELKKFTEKHR